MFAYFHISFLSSQHSTQLTNRYAASKRVSIPYKAFRNSSLLGNNANVCLDKNFASPFFFPYSITHFRLPRWCWRTKDALKIIRAERKEREKKNRRGGWGWKANLCDWGWWGPDKVSAHLFTPGGRRRFFKRQQLQSSISEESWMPKRKTAVIVVWFLQNDGDLFLEKRSKYFFFYFAIHSLWKVFISAPKICSPRLQFRFFPAHLTPVLKQFIR